jgi:predicted glycoside hydrolase/deacetylase ChbG (UPF0249 family)
MKLLLNADDLGYTPAINQAIFDLHGAGRLSSASLLVNMPYSQHAVDGLHSYPVLRVGVHLNLTKGRPLLPPRQIPSLVNGAGAFWPTKQFFLRAVARFVNIQEVELELQAQIERVLDAGIRPTHLDSHSHWHVLPYLRSIVTRLGMAYQIPGMRQTAPRRTLLPSSFWVRMAARKALPQMQTRIPDFMLSLHQWMKEDGRPIDLFFSRQLQRLITQPEIALELVTHPGKQADPEFPPDTLLTHQRQWEYDFLLSPEFEKWLKKIGAEIINYAAL